MLESAVAEIAALAEGWACAVRPAEAARIVGFLAQLLEWNSRINLTGAIDMGELIGEHLPDSFALSKLTPPAARVVDVGAGGGLPGVPFALLRPDCKVTLVEPRAKRVAFLRAAGRSLGPVDPFAVIRGRDADLPLAGFDVADSRATFAPDAWIGIAERIVAPGGRVIVFASSPVEGREGWRLEDAVSYSTGRGAARWAGAYVPRGTVPHD